MRKYDLNSTIISETLLYPDSYKPAMPRLFKLIDDWKVLGAY